MIQTITKRKPGFIHFPGLLSLISCVKAGEIETASWRGLKEIIMESKKEFHKQQALPFYSTAAWVNCRTAYAKSRAHLCERCLAKGIIKTGEIVHHIIELTPDNINDPQITVNWDNLMLVCRECHADIHKEETTHRRKKRFIVDKFGHVTASEPPLSEKIY